MIATAPSRLFLGSALALAGTGFRGISGAGAGGGQDSATNYPLVQLRSVESGQTAFLRPGSPWTDATFRSVPVTSFPPGLALATVFASGIPSASALVQVNGFGTTSLLGIAREAGGLRVQWSDVVPGASYRIEESEALGGPWEPRQVPVTASAGGIVEYLDASKSAPPQRFYRLVTPP